MLNNLKKHQGYIFAIIAVIFYALINVFSQAADNLLGKTTDPLLFSAAFITIKEMVANISYFISGKSPIKRYKNIINLFKGNKKGGIWASIAGILGGAIGFTLTTAGGIYVGSGLASPFYSIEVIILFGVSKLFFKRRVTTSQYIGILILSTGIIMIPVLNQVLHGNAVNSRNAWLGLTLVILGVFCWAAEAGIFDRITENNNYRVETFVAIKQISSLVFVVLFIIPGFSLSLTHNYYHGYEVLGSCFSNWKVLLLIISSGILLFIGRLFFFKSTKIIGATMSNIFYNSLAFFQIPISFVASAIDPSVNYVGAIHHEYFWVFLLMIAVGIFLSAMGQIKLKGQKL